MCEGVCGIVMCQDNREKFNDFYLLHLLLYLQISTDLNLCGMLLHVALEKMKLCTGF